MANKLQVGDRVKVRLYNTPDRRFYGQTFEATIVPMPSSLTVRRDFTVRDNGGVTLTVWRKEIRGRVK